MSNDNLDALIKAADLTQDEIGEVLGVKGPAVNHKLAGRRRWYRDDINKLLGLLSAKLGRVVSYEEAFGSDPAEESAEPVSAGKGR